MSLLLTLLFRRLVPTPTAAFRRDSNPRPQLLRVSSNHSATLAVAAVVVGVAGVAAEAAAEEAVVVAASSLMAAAAAVAWVAGVEQLWQR